MVKFFASGTNFSCKVSPTILLRREISLSVKRTFLYIKIHFPRELLRKLPLLPVPVYMGVIGLSIGVIGQFPG